MNSHRMPASRAAWAFFLGAALSCSGAWAAAKTGAADALARYRLEQAACNSGQSPQDRATCLREARAALSEARRGQLNDGAAAYSANALKRCERVPAEERQDCVARMQGQGTTSAGSVAGGAIVRERVTRETLPASAVPSDAAASDAAPR